MMDSTQDSLIQDLDALAQGALSRSATNAAQDSGGLSELETLASFFERSQGLTRSEAADKAAQMYIAGKIKTEAGSPRLSPTPIPKAKDWDAEFSTHKKIAGNQLKLSKAKQNFVLWLMGFRNLIDNVPLAQEHLEGVEHDVGFPGAPLSPRTERYCYELDKELARVLLQTLEPEVSTILVPHHNSGERRASVLFRTLRKQLLRDDPASQDRVAETIQGLKQNTHDVTTLADTFRYYFTYSSLIGNPVGQADEVRYFLKSLHPRYNSFKQAAAFHRSTSEGRNASFDYFVEQLLLQESNMQGESTSEHAFAVAMQASGTPSAQALVVYQPQSSSQKGKDPSLGPKFSAAKKKGSSKNGGGGGQPHDGCHRCHQKGHWASECKLSWAEVNALVNRGKGQSPTAALAAQEQQAMVVATRQQ
ncbi:hypothetical protein CF336_g7513 [Tilletia laevis]|nr:hypothetical protein CF336_g7513 [Tilletia laevis]